MKRIVLILALLSSAITGFAQVKDAEGHTLVNLWKTFYNARQADLPQDQVKALETIKSEAAARHLAWDWYDAATRYVSVRSNINWKDRTELTNALKDEVNNSKDPIIKFFHFNRTWSSEEVFEFLRDNQSALEKAHNPEFYSQDSRITGLKYSDVLLKRLNNDYEYALWSSAFNNNTSLLESYYKGKYPEEAFVEYSIISKWSTQETREKLDDYINKYQGKAVSLLARQYCLRYDFRTLRNDGKSSQEQYKKLRKDCEKFETDRKKFTGSEKLIADCCTDVEDLIKSLDGKEISLRISDGELTVILQNISSVQLSVLDGDNILHKAALTNRAASYYVRDTVKYILPDINDGDYNVLCKSGSVEGKTLWKKHSLSIAIRSDSEGYRFFVADYKSGEPLKSCNLLLLDADDKTVSSAGGVKLNGFTRFPSNIQNYYVDKKGSYYLRVTYKDSKGILRSSGSISASSSDLSSARDDSNPMVRNAMLITDRGAFNPGETIYFKGICYKGTYAYELSPKGTDVKVSLLDPEGKLIADKRLKTNEFGSVDGSFQLDKGSSRGGMYMLTIESSGGTVLESRSIRVDEFVLPTYTVLWDTDRYMYLSEDEMTVKGKVVAYSGHSLSNAKARYEVTQRGREIIGGELSLTPDGSFAFKVPVAKKGSSFGRYFVIRVTVVDATGETLEFSTTRQRFSQIPLNLNLENRVSGYYSRTTMRTSYSGGNWIVCDDEARFNFNTGGLDRDDLTINYKLISESGKEVSSGSASAGQTVGIKLNELNSGLYKLDVLATVAKPYSGKPDFKSSYNFVKASDSDTALDMDVACFFKEPAGNDIALQIGSTDGPVWAVVELFGNGNIFLDQQMVTLDGVRARNGSLKNISYKRRPEWPDNLSLKVLWFHKGECYEYNRDIELPSENLNLPLEFTRFQDKARPGEEFSLMIKTDPGVECAATVFDKATETIASNVWNQVLPRTRYWPHVYYRSVCGRNDSDMFFANIYYTTEAIAEDGAVPFRMESKSMNAGNLLEAASAKMRDNADLVENEDLGESVSVRENFGATMAWEPILRSDAQGNIELNLTGADRLSTYYVQLFAHGAGMRNATLRREVQVTIPVKLSLVEPKYLYENDIYVARATVASTLEESVSGRVAIRFYDGADYRNSQVIGVKTERVTLPARGAITVDARFPVPEGLREIGVLLNFVPDDPESGTDAMFVRIPVYKPFQTLTEAHSALLRNPADWDRTVAELRSLFVNMDASQLVPQERSILDMVRDAIPDKVEPRSNDVMSLTEAWYANVLARRIGAPGLDDGALREVGEKISACQNSGGGIAWFEGMESSPVITAAVLERIAAMPESNCEIDIASAVKYLDDSYFNRVGLPWWWGGLSLEQYLHTRAMFPSVPFKAGSGKAFRQFRKDVKAYLVPTGKRGLNGQILAKARRLQTLQMLNGSDDGRELAKAWGITFKKRIQNSIDADVRSLLQYAVEHKSGGYYYPNAVMPWRGLLESELYAHTLLCNLLETYSSTTSEGIRLWLMIQKETQHWDTDAAYIEALAAVLRGTPETLGTKVIVLSGSYTKPFEEVKASGNGFTVSCNWYIDGRAKPLEEGDVLQVGDKVTARYSIWNEENRSFVRISAPRPASFRPVKQLSGHYGWWLSPFRYGGFSFCPQGYRNVLADKTEYWFDTYPEENTVITEEFFVTQEGAFQLPAIEIESLYAPHYRANGAGRGALVSESR